MHQKVFKFQILFPKDSKFVGVHIIFYDKRAPAFSLFAHTVLHIGHHTSKRNFFIYKSWHVTKHRNIAITEILHFEFKIIQRMSRNINSYDFFFSGEFFHRSPCFTRRNFGFFYLNIARFSKQTDLRRVFIFLIAIGIFNGFF